MNGTNWTMRHDTPPCVSAVPAVRVVGQEQQSKRAGIAAKVGPIGRVDVRRTDENRAAFVGSYRFTIGLCGAGFTEASADSVEE